MAAATLLLFVASSHAHTRRALLPSEPAGMPSITSKATGVLIGRLTARQMRTWRSILGIVLARDRWDRPLHPTLNRLWHQAETGSHIIHIELSDRRCPTCAAAAGSCTVERLDPAGLKHVLAIRLDLDMIDRAHVGKIARRSDGFIPFHGLTKEERYAEVLGHELAHAVQLSLDADYMSLYQGLNCRARKYMDSGGLEHSRPEDQRSNADLRELLEGPAETAEAEIWRELMSGHHTERGLPLSSDSVTGRMALYAPGARMNAGHHVGAGK